MTTKTKIFTSLAALLCALGISTTASAEDFSLHLSGGATEDVNTPNANQLFHGPFQLGQSFSAKGDFNLSPNLAFGPQVSSLYLQNSAPTNQPGVLFGAGLGVRVQGNSDASWRPYWDFGAAAYVQNHIYNPGIDTSVGFEMPLEETHTFWFGPMVSFTHVFDAAVAQPSLLPNRDLNAMTVGLSLSFDVPVKQKVQTVVFAVPVAVPVSVPAPAQTPCPPPVAVPAAKHAPTLNQVVLFRKGSAKLGHSAQKVLDGVVSAMNSDTSYRVVVQGRASAEGPVKLNLELSKARADMVAEYLTSHGVSADRVSSTEATGAVGAPNDASNRSVHFITLTVSQ